MGKHYERRIKNKPQKESDYVEGFLNEFLDKNRDKIEELERKIILLETELDLIGF